MKDDQLKALLKKGVNGLPNKYKLPIELVELWAKESKEIRSHYNGDMPEGLFKKPFPSEREEYRKYREENFQAITRSSIVRALGALYRIFSQANHSIKYEDGFSEYMNQARFNGLSFSKYIFKTFITNSVCDPNGFLVVFPKKPQKTNEAPEVELIAVDYSKIVIDPRRSAGLMIFELKGEVDEVIGGIHYKGGKKFAIITEDYYYHYYETSKKGGKQVKFYVPFCPNYTSEITAISNGGVEASCVSEFTENFEYSISYFAHAIPFLNEARIDHTLHQVNKVLNGSPKLVVGGTQCTACHGQGIMGQEYCEEKQCDITIHCDNCKGLGFTKTESQFEAIEVVPPTNASLGEVFKFIYEYITVPIENLEHFGNEYRKNLEMANKALLIHFLEEAQSGVAKEVDREEKYSSFFSISDYIFDTVMAGALKWMDVIRGKGRSVGFTIHKPISFQIKSEMALWEELCAKLEKNAPKGDIIATYFDYLSKRYTTNKKMQKIERFCVLYEPNYIYTIDQRQMLQASDNINKETSIKATRVLDVLLVICEEMGDQQFMDLSFAEVKKMIDERMQEYLLKEENNGLSSEQKRLRGLVGTMRSITELQTAVTNGEMDRENAINSIVFNLGFTKEEAEGLIGQKGEKAEVT